MYLTFVGLKKFGMSYLNKRTAKCVRNFSVTVLAERCTVRTLEAKNRNGCDGAEKQ